MMAAAATGAHALSVVHMLQRAERAGGGEARGERGRGGLTSNGMQASFPLPFLSLGLLRKRRGSKEQEVTWTLLLLLLLQMTSQALK